MVNRGLCPKLLLSEGWKNQNPNEGNVMCGPDGLLPSLDKTVQAKVPGVKKRKAEVMAEGSKKNMAITMIIKFSVICSTKNNNKRHFL